MAEEDIVLAEQQGWNSIWCGWRIEYIVYLGIYLYLFSIPDQIALFISPVSERSGSLPYVPSYSSAKVNFMSETGRFNDDLKLRRGPGREF